MSTFGRKMSLSVATVEEVRLYRSSSVVVLGGGADARVGVLYHVILTGRPGT
jgi:hypothetical protein